MQSAEYSIAQENDLLQGFLIQTHVSRLQKLTSERKSHVIRIQLPTDNGSDANF